MKKTNLDLLGRVEDVEFPGLLRSPIKVRVDTGAKTSALWASDVRESNGELNFKLFGPGARNYNGETISTREFSQRAVANSGGGVEVRYVVKLVIIVGGRRVRASFTLSDRSKQAYPALIGRNILRGKFIVDVRLGKNSKAESARSDELQSNLEKGKNL